MAKQVISILQPGALSPREYVIPAITTPAENVIIIFQNGFTTQNLEVVQLAAQELPLTYNGGVVDWIANFGIREKGTTDKYVNVPYTVIMTQRANRLLVYYDGTSVKPAPAQTSTLKGKVSFDLNDGDPGVGWDGAT